MNSTCKADLNFRAHFFRLFKSDNLEALNINKRSKQSLKNQKIEIE